MSWRRRLGKGWGRLDMKYRWGELISLEYGKPVKDKSSLNGSVPVYGTNGKIGTSHLPPLCPNASFILGRKGAYRGVHYSNIPFSVIDTAFYAKNLVPDKLSLKWAYYMFLTYDINNMDSGSAIPSTDRYEIYAIEVELPSFEEQLKIVQILEVIDSKIELNQRINDNLEQQAQSLFIQRFIIDDLEGSEKPLYDFADYINGTSFKPNECGDHGFPIIKIAELKNGITDSTKYFNGAKDEKYLIQNGDILFSWSGNPDTSIDVFIWTHGKAILNQHTFNVKSNTGHRWFTFLMLKYFKSEFSRIASNKQTTGLGHVTVSDLKRLTFIFNRAAIEYFEREITPFMEKIYSNMMENQRLIQLRDILLSKFMSGEIDVSAIQL